MRTYADVNDFADELGARRRRAAEAAPPILLALGESPASAGSAPDGAPLDGRASGGPVLSAPVRATAELLATALSDLGEAEEELRVQNEALFAAHTELEAEQQAVLELFELAPVAYIVTTADGRMVRMNQAAFSLLGQPRNLAVGKPLALYAVGEDRAAFHAALARTCLSPHVETWRVRLLPRNGEALECRVRVRAVKAHISTGPSPSIACQTERVVLALYWVITPQLSDPGDVV